MNRPVTLLRLFLKFFRRDWRGGGLPALFLAVTVAVGATTTVAYFTQRLNLAMHHQAQDLIGADLVVSGSQPVDEQWLATAASMDLRVSVLLEFTSMVAHGDALVLSAIKAVSEGYPHRGSLGVRLAEQEPMVDVQQGPQPGEIWAEARLLEELGVGIGAEIEVGSSLLPVSRILDQEPDRTVSGLFSMNPRLMVHLDDIAATGLVVPGSRVTWRTLFSGAGDDIADFQQWLQPQLGAHYRIISVSEDQPAVASALERAGQFLGLATIATVVLSGVSISMAARLYARRHFHTSALLRCLGASGKTLGALYTSQVLMAGVLASTLGSLLGLLFCELLIMALRELLPPFIPPAGMAPALLGYGAGVVLLLGFALPPLLQLQRVSALRLLQSDLSPLPPAAWLVFAAALGSVLLFVGYFAEDFRLAGIFVGGLLAFMLLSALIAWTLLRTVGTVLPWLPFSLRMGIQGLLRRRGTALLQMVAFSAGLCAIAIVVLLRTDLLRSWQQQVPPDAPNHFAINIQPHDAARVAAFMDEHDIRRASLYPMVRGRLTHINGRSALEVVPESARDDNILHRELNITWSAEVPRHNVLVEGQWWEDHRAEGEAVISIEQGMARRLGLQQGDELTFSFAGQSRAARVTSVRQVDWNSFQPNFYVIFAPGQLPEQWATSMTSFYLPPEQKGFIRQLVQQFPSVTVLEVDRILGQVQGIISQVSRSVEYVLLFVLISGFVLLFTIVQSTIGLRLHESSLLRTFGASTAFLRSNTLAEFTFLGLLSGILATLITHGLAWILYRQVFDLPLDAQWLLWGTLPLGAMILVGCAGLWASRSVVQQSPVDLLRENRDD